MSETISQIVIKTMIRKALRDIRESPERSTRNLVDLAAQFAGSRFQQHFFGTAQKMLEDPESTYYTLAKNLANRVEDERIITFGMNLGYNGCMNGAERIRRSEAELNCNIPWAIALEIGSDNFRNHAKQYHDLITQGESLGIHTWMLFSAGDPFSCLELASGHPNSAFTLFCDSTQISWTLIDCMENANNIMLSIPIDKFAPTACSLLRETGLLYSVYHTYTKDDLSRIENGTLFKEIARNDPIFAILIPEKNCPMDVRTRVIQHVQQTRLDPKYPVIPWDLIGDTLLVDSIISDEAVWVSFDKNGELYQQRDTMPILGCNIFETDLTAILLRGRKKDLP